MNEVNSDDGVDDGTDDVTDEGTDEDTDEDDVPFRHVFLIGDRVRVRPTFGDFTELSGLTGTVTQNGEDVQVRFDNPPVTGGALWHTVSHAAHNFEHIQ